MHVHASDGLRRGNIRLLQLREKEKYLPYLQKQGALLVIMRLVHRQILL